MFENRKEPLLRLPAFIARIMSSIGVASVLVLVSLGIGTLGYHKLGGLLWIDAFLNAAMILTGMGPVNEIHTTSGKLFAAFYALYSGVAFLTMLAVLFAPVIHRFLHKFHLDLDTNNERG